MQARMPLWVVLGFLVTLIARAAFADELSPVLPTYKTVRPSAAVTSHTYSQKPRCSNSPEKERDWSATITAHLGRRDVGVMRKERQGGQMSASTL